VIFAFHGFPGAIHQVVHGRPDADHLRVRGFIEQGTTTTSFDMTALNRVTRYHLVMDAINNARRTLAGSSELPSTHLGNSKAAISQVTQTIFLCDHSRAAFTTHLLGIFLPWHPFARSLGRRRKTRPHAPWALCHFVLRPTPLGARTEAGEC
jgi:XFP C-terminal domain